ncbi:MAG: Cytosine deaminase [Hyphomicrobiales bacterium]|nr:Cytosine deaminase [Hyphomicrobiales bacterium]
MEPISAPNFPAAGYAIHADIALGPDGTMRDAVLVVVNGVIQELSPAADYVEGPNRQKLLRLPECALIPSFIDVHHHIIEPFVKSLTGGEPAQLWKRFWLPLEAAITPQSAHDGAKWTFLEALRGGMTTIVDHGIRTHEIADAIHQAADETGIRLVSSTGAYDLKNFTTAAERTPDLVTDVSAALKIAERHMEECAKFARIKPSLACGTVQSNSGTMIRTLSKFCQDNDILFQIHANEHTLEVHASIEAYARRPIEYLHDLGALGRTTLVAHATLVTSDEIRLLQETDTAVAYNPVACIWKGNAVAPALDYMTRGIRVGLGSDGTRNDGFRMLDAAEACQRIAYGMPRDDFSCGAGWRWVHAATQGGADSILMGDEIGALSPGRKADFLILDCSGPEVRPCWDFTWELVRQYDRADILATFVDGEPVCIGGKSTRFNSSRFLSDAEPHAIQSVIDARLVRLHPTSEAAKRMR